MDPTRYGPNETHPRFLYLNYQYLAPLPPKSLECNFFLTNAAKYNRNIFYRPNNCRKDRDPLSVWAYDFLQVKLSVLCLSYGAPTTICSNPKRN